MPYPKWFREQAVKELGLICRYGDDRGDCLSVGSSHRIQLHSKSELHIPEISDAQFLCTKHHQGGVHVSKSLTPEKKIKQALLMAYSVFMSDMSEIVDLSLVRRKSLRGKLESFKRQLDKERREESKELCLGEATDDFDVLNFCDESSSVQMDIGGSKSPRIHWKGCSCCRRLFIVDGNVARRRKWVCSECKGTALSLHRGYVGIDRTAVYKLLGVKSDVISAREVSHEMRKRGRRNVYHATKDYIKRRLKNNPEYCVELSNLNLKGVYGFFKTHNDFLPEATCFMSKGRLRVNKVEGADSGGMDVATVRDYARKLVDEWQVKFPACFSKNEKSTIIDIEQLKNVVESYREPVSESQKLYHKKKYEAQKPTRDYIKGLKASNPEEYKRLQVKAGLT